MMSLLTVEGIPAHLTVRGEGEKTLFLVHGAGGNGLHFMDLKPPQGWRLMAVDLPGHGQTAGEAFTDVFACADWVAKCIREAGGCDVLAGHSMGGAITLAVALNHAPLLQGIILLSTGARLGVSQAILDLCREGAVAGIENFLADFAFGPIPSPEQIRRWYQLFGQASCQTYFRDFSACNQFDVRERLGQIQLPSLVVCGREDRMTPLKYSQFLAAGLPRATLEEIPDAGHMVMLEQPDPVSEAIDRFCRSLA
jgi:pimeloyl-ACP methyl ester carboxylesterase